MRIATFNCENLYVYHRLRDKDIRFRTRHKLDDLDYDGEGVRINALKGGWSISEKQRLITAKCINARQPDIIALQEVESLDVLNKFLTDFVHKKTVKDERQIFSEKRTKVKWKYPYRVLIDGNDNHRIDVALLSRYEIVDIRTHFWEKYSPRTDYFPRDCLEADVKLPNGKIITFLVNHFTSRRSDRKGVKRERQAKRVIEILKERFGPKLDRGNFVICGDLNDEPDDSALKNTFYKTSLGLVNPIENLPKDQRWTHYWYNDKGRPNRRPFSQLDHIILSPSFKKNNENAHVIMERRGLLQTFKEKVNDDFPLEKPFDGVTSKPGTEGSDHCAVFVDLNVDKLV